MVSNAWNLLSLIIFIKSTRKKSTREKHGLFRALHRLFQAGFSNLPPLTNLKSHGNRSEFNYIINSLSLYIFIEFKLI